MYKMIFFVSTLLISLQLSGQEKLRTIKGIVIENYSKTRISGVTLSPTFFDSTIVTNDKGKFQVLVPEKYRDTVVFSHPDYYTVVKRVKRGIKNSSLSIAMVNSSRKLDTLCYIAYKGNRLIKGEIIDTYKGEPLPEARISLPSMKIIAYSDMNGEFEIAIPLSTEYIVISHPHFDTTGVLARKRNKYYNTLSVKMNRIVFKEQDTLWKKKKNTIYFAVNELATGSIGLSYHRFIHHKHALGLQTSSYLFGRGRDLNCPQSSFKGIKLTPYYRFYFARKMTSSGFYYTKFEFGYFDFEKLYYGYPQDVRKGESYPWQFNTYGFGIGGGWSVLLPKTKHFVFSIVAGFQYFSMQAPKTQESDYYGTLELKNNWWYFFGPGSLFEIKLLLGGIF